MCTGTVRLGAENKRGLDVSAFCCVFLQSALRVVRVH